jgi:anti-anti-sigma regulatory factor
MPTRLGRTKIRVQDDRLVVGGELGPEDEKRFANALFNYLRSGRRVYELDFTRLRHMGSVHIGYTCLFAQLAGQDGRAVLVIANRKLASVLHRSGLTKIARLKVSDPPAGPPQGGRIPL